MPELLPAQKAELTRIYLTASDDFEIIAKYRGPTPWGEDRIGFSAWTELDREDFGLTWNQALETGGVVVGKKVRIELGLEAVRR